MRIHLESAKRIGRKIGLDEERGYAVAIFLALIIVSATIAGYYLVLRPQAEPYNTLYLLDAQKKAADYPVTLITNQNSTFNIYVDVENHLNADASYQIQVKITNYLNTFPLSTPVTQTIETGTVKNDGKPVENTATITENRPGSYYVVFELWQHKGNAVVFTEDYCILPINVTR